MDLKVVEQLKPYLEARSVRAEMFTDTGKWKYSVKLDYAQTAAIVKMPSGYIDPGEAAALALAFATRQGTSGVNIEVLPERWSLVVFDPPNGWPVLVHGGFAGLSDALFGERR